MKYFLPKIFLLVLCLTVFSTGICAQFKEEAFKQSYVNPSDTTAKRDSIDKMWSFKEFFRGVYHKDSVMRIGTLFAGSTVFIGSEQIYNRQYWKLPIVYGGLGATVGLGLHYRSRYRTSLKAYEAAYALDPETSLTVDTRSKDMATWLFAGAGVLYWSTLMDGIVNYHGPDRLDAGRATIYSILLPGLGQAYNGEFWKIPIYWGGIMGSLHFYSTNNTNYLRYKRIHNEATDPEGTYSERIPAERALYYRDVFRRFRDYSMVAIIGFYLLQVIDANVFAYMKDFEVTDDLSMRIAPTVITPDSAYAFNPDGNFGIGRTASPLSGSNAFGFKIGITF